MRRLSIRRVLPFALLPLAAACADGFVAAPPDAAPKAEPALARLDCTADVRAGTVLCAAAAPAMPAGARGSLVLGWQGGTVRLASSGASYDGGMSIFRVDVTVRNLLGQPIGTEDGVTQAPIRVFFASGPVATAGNGTVEVENEDGTAMFMSAIQPYHEYGGILSTDEVSAAKEWRFTMPSTVARFGFTVYVSAPVPDENALQAIDLDPRTLAVGGYHSCALA
ncbi:hypothetical protein, partial [Longimicrobium sp.]|uniref:hypothetical protein n=1 Tax=Longimicrobium sp. TaxID=2029185 RepID=UPI002E37A63A